MLDGRTGILLSGCFLVVSACGGSGDIGAAVAPSEPTPTVTPEPTVEILPDETSAPVVQTPSVEAGLCDGANPPSRCAADPATFSAYGVAAVISALEVLDDASCCVDFTGDQRPDNALGEGFAAIDRLDVLNDELHNSLVNGSQTILMEVEGLDDARNDDDVSVHVYGGQRAADSPSTNPSVELDPATIAGGVAPLFSFDNASVVDGRLVATKGSMELEASFNGVLLKPTVHDVSVSARIDSATADGLTLRDGEIGGRLALQDIVKEINAVAAGCDCLGLDGLLVDRSRRSSCAAPDPSACESAGRETCAALVEVCPVIDIIASNIADVDSNGDGTMDSISLGGLFEADAATISGVMR